MRIGSERGRKDICVTRNEKCSPGFGTGISTSVKSHPLSEKENGWFFDATPTDIESEKTPPVRMNWGRDA